MFSDPVTDAVNDAVARLIGGASVEEIESQLLDCKEPAGTVTRTGGRVGVADLGPAGRDDTARQMAAEVTCLAHGGGGALIIGLRDDRSGLDAVVGTDIDADWLRLRIHELTTPSLTVAIHPLDIAGVTGLFGPLLVVQIPPAVELHSVARSDGSGDRPHRWRVGPSCKPMSAADQAVFVARVRPVDWSAQPTSHGPDDIDPGAVEVARDLQPRLRPCDNVELLNRLGVLDSDGRLSRAGALLFCHGDHETIVFTVHDVTGAPSRIGRIAYHAPLLVTLQELLVRLDTVLPVELLPAAGVQRASIQSVPIAVAREAVANAIAHRDWTQPTPITISVTAGAVVEVTSPGGFPAGVTTTNLLSHPSRPTNPALAHALTVLQIAERQGVGVDLMFREMIRLGHQPPEIDAIGTNVRCRLVGGPAHPGTVRLFDTLPEPARDDVEIALIVHLLHDRKQVTASDVATAIQRSANVAAAALQRAGDLGLIERLNRTSTTWRATRTTLEQLAPTPPVARRRSTDELVLDTVRYAQHASGPFARTDIEHALQVGERRARQILEELVTRQWLAPTGPTTGRAVRYQQGPRWKNALTALSKR